MIMQSPAADWRTSEVLLRMHTETKFLDEVAEQLLTMAKAAAPIIDHSPEQSNVRITSHGLRRCKIT